MLEQSRLDVIISSEGRVIVFNTTLTVFNWRHWHSFAEADLI